MPDSNNALCFGGLLPVRTNGMRGIIFCMLPIDFEGSNITLSKPADMTDEQCMSVRAYKGVDMDGFPFHLIAVKPNKDDIAAINAGHPIFLKVLGETFAPVALYTLNEKGEIN